MSRTTSSHLETRADPNQDLELVESLSDLLYRSEPADGGLDSQLLDLHCKYGDGVYAELIHLLSHLRFDAAEAKDHWLRIAEHQDSLQQKLGTSVDVRVALLSYFVDVSKKLSNPKIMELKLFEETQASLYRDELTGLCNFRYFRDHLTREIRRADRYNQLLSLVMMDIDDFKSYNDENGHESGNEALATIARLLAESLRTIDVPARYGGEEFAFILPTTSKSDAQMVAERARSRIEDHVFSSAGEPDGTTLTVSMGIATFPSDASNGDELIRHADSALYVAKTLGKNQVHLYGHCRRSYYRLETTLQGNLRELATEKQAFTAVNLSERGLLVHLDKKLTENTLLDLDIQLPGSTRKVALSGRVIRVNKLKSGEFETAIRIVEMPPREQRLLSEFIRANQVNSESDGCGAPTEEPLEEPVSQ
jgi:diguanylate cyclase (GGDEF)-like protein